MCSQGESTPWLHVMVAILHSGDLDMDGDGGRLLLRILIMMTMSKHPNLVSQALKLVISHFSQRKEMVNGFRKVREEALGDGMV